MFDIHSVEQMLNEQAKNSELTSDPKNKALRKEWATTKRLNSLQLLQALRQFIPVELPKIQFNYFQMHHDSLSLMEILKIKCDAEFRTCLGPKYLPRE